MHMTFSTKLRDYMHRRGYHVIEVAIAETSDTAGLAEIAAIPLKPNAANKVREKAVRIVEIEGGGEVFIMNRGLEYDEEIHFDLKNFLGIKHVEVKGIRAFSLR